MRMMDNESFPTALVEERLGSITTLSAPAKALLIQSMTSKSISRGESLLREGEVCYHISFVETGFLRTFHNKDGKEINLNFTLPNNFVTDLKSLRNECPSDVTIQAGERTRVWQIGKRDLLSLYSQSTEISEFGRKLLELLLSEQEEHANAF